MFLKLKKLFYNMDGFLTNLEFLNSSHNTWSPCSIIGTFGEKSFVVEKKNKSTDIAPIEQIRQIIKVSPTEIPNSSTEYESSPEEFISCQIKKHQGKFFSLTLKDNQVILSRENNLRYIQTLPLSQIINTHFSNISIPIPSELSTRTNSENFKEMIKNIQEENNEQYLFYYNIYPTDKPKYLRLFCLKEKSEIIKIIIETAIDNELKLCHISNDKNLMKQQIEDVKNKNKIIYINPKYVGIIIGTQGVNLKKLKKQYKVNIFIDNNSKNEKGEVKVSISGDNTENVEACADECNFVEKHIPVKIGQENNLKKMALKMNSTYGLKSFYVNFNDIELDDENILPAPSVSVLGPEKYIDYMISENLYYFK